MKYIRKTKSNITKDFLLELLFERGIIDKHRPSENFFRPNAGNLLNPNLLDNIGDAAKLFLEHIKKGSRIYVVVDPDVDGYTSSAVLINYMNEVLKPLFPDFTVEYHIPEGKAHGLATIIDIFTETDNRICDLIILPDSSSNDYAEHKTLKSLGYDTIVLDHHLSPSYSEDAIVVNNQLSEVYENKELSGVGVVYKFLKVCDDYLKIAAADQYLDLVALGQVSDMMSMMTLENRYICDYGLSHVNNKLFRMFIEKQEYSLGSEPLNQIGVAMYITPLINALIRVGTQVQKEDLFKAFVDSDEIVPSTKRGEKGLTETIGTQTVRNCVNARVKQNREKAKALDFLSIQISNDCLDDNKILILNADELDISNSLTGLCAMGVAANYKKPTMLGRSCGDGYFRGSIRCQDGTELKDFRQFLLDSKYMEYVEG